MTPADEGPTAVELQFVKMHGCGNDFIMVEDLSEEWDLAPEAIELLCDRHFGIGADGLILVRPASEPEADAFMLYYNSDGTTAEMCGNGVRCFAKYVVDRGIVSAEKDSLVVQTLGGLKSIDITRDYEGKLYLATVDMGEPQVRAELVPTMLRDDTDQTAIAVPVETPWGTVSVTCVSMGNPHAVIFVDDVESAPVDELGPWLETHEAFPNRTNVEFAQVAGDDVIRLRVWERGCGETLACGTGACATLAAATLTCRAGREATVELLGGELAIRWDEAGSVMMTGPAVEVFSGALAIEEDDDLGE